MWTYRLANLAGEELGEIKNATDRNLQLAINRPSTASFTMKPSDEMLSYIFADDTLLQVWEDKTLRFYGNVVSSEFATQEAGGSPTIKINAANPAWKLSKRLLGLNNGGDAYSGDKAKMAWKMLNKLNTDTVTYPTKPYTGIKLNSEASYSSGSTGSYTAGPYKSALGCINDLAHGIDGFDWYISPLDEGETIGLWEAKAVYGTEASAVFEHGYGSHNVKQITYLRDLGNLANKAFHLPDEGLGEVGAEVKVGSNSPSLEHRGRYEEVADAFGIVDGGLRQSWVDDVVKVKGNPRFVAGMTLAQDDGTGRVPQIGTEFWLGDMVTARSVVENVTLFNGKVRVYQINIAVNDAGTASITPILIEESE